MRIGRWGWRVAMVLAGLAGVAPAVRADAVRVQTSGNDFGQGWRFLDGDGQCKVVTARHVVVGADGRFLRVGIHDAHGRVASASAASVDDPDLDIAVLAVPAQNDPSICGGALALVGLERRVHANTPLVVALTKGSESEAVAVTRRATRIDGHGGDMFAIGLLNPADRVAQGWSGSAVLDASGPLGIVVNADPERGEALVLRIDMVNRLAARQGRAASAGALPAGQILAGTTVDPAHDLSEALSPAAGAPGWTVLPERRAVVFTLAYAQPVQLRRFRLTAAMGEGLGQVRGFLVATSAEKTGEDWLQANYCAAGAEIGAIVCSILPSTVRRLKVTLNAVDNRPLRILGWSAE